MKAQAVVEFMAVFIIILVVFSVIIAIGFQKNQEVLRGQVDSRAKSIVNSVSNKINTAFISGEGFETSIQIPDSIEGVNYSIDISQNFVTIEVKGNSYTQILLTNNITGNVDHSMSKVINKGDHILII